MSPDSRPASGHGDIAAVQNAVAAAIKQAVPRVSGFYSEVHRTDAVRMAEAAVGTLACALQREIDARLTPPHLDGTYREGVYQGLLLAQRIVTGTPDEHPEVSDDPDSVIVHRYPTCRIAPESDANNGGSDATS